VLGGGEEFELFVRGVDEVVDADGQVAHLLRVTGAVEEAEGLNIDVAGGWFVATAMAAPLPRLLQALGATPAAGGRLIEFSVLRRASPMISARPSTRGNSNRAGLHSVDIGKFLSGRLCHRRTSAGSEPRCT
jgi:hypothetical protein